MYLSATEENFSEGEKGEEIRGLYLFIHVKKEEELLGMVYLLCSWWIAEHLLLLRWYRGLVSFKGGFRGIGRINRVIMDVQYLQKLITPVITCR